MLSSHATRWQRFTLDQPDIQVIRDLVVIGAGGHGRELADIVRAATASDPNARLLGIADDGDPDRGLLERTGFRFLGDSGPMLRRDVDIVIGVGDPLVRERIDAQAPELAAAPISHPTATVGSLCELAPGVVLAQGSVVTTNVHLGRHTHVNVRASVSHDCRVGDYVTICPDVAITGNARIGNRAFIGTSATLLPGVSVGPDAIIGAGAVVCEDVAPGTVVRGVPAR